MRTAPDLQLTASLCESCLAAVVAAVAALRLRDARMRDVGERWKEVWKGKKEKQIWIAEMSGYSCAIGISEGAPAAATPPLAAAPLDAAPPAPLAADAAELMQQALYRMTAAATATARNTMDPAMTPANCESLNACSVVTSVKPPIGPVLPPLMKSAPVLDGVGSIAIVNV